MRTKFTFLIMFFVLYAYAQPLKRVEEFKDFLMQTKGGAMFVFNGSNHAFSIEIISAKLKPTDDQLALLIDNIIFRPFVLPSNSVIDFDRLADEKKKEELLDYIKYEFEYFKNDLKQDISNLNYEWIRLNNKLFIYWTYDMPRSNKMVEKQLYMTTICFDNILTLNLPYQIKTKPLDFHKVLLINISKSLKSYNSVIDLEKMYKDKN